MKTRISVTNFRRAFIALAAVLAMLLFVLAANGSRVLSGGTLRLLTAWNDESGAVSLPAHPPQAAGNRYSIRTVLPSALSERDCLIFRTENLPVTVTLGETVLYQTALPAAHQTLGDEWHALPLSPQAAGQTLTITGTLVFPNGSNFLDAVYLGDKADFLQAVFRLNLSNLVVCVLLVLLGVGLLCASLLMKRQLVVLVPLPFALLCILLGVWMGTQTEIPELLRGKTAALLFLTYALLPFCTTLICLFLRTLPAPGWVKKVYFWLGISQLVQGVAAIVLENLHLAAFMETLPYTRIAMMLAVVPFVFQLPGLLRKFHENFYLFTGFFCMATMILIDLFSVYSGTYDYAHNTRFGLLLMALLISLQSAVRLRQSLRMVDEAELMRRLAYRDSLTGLGNRLALVRDQEVLLARKTGCVGIVQMDVNNLKDINDRFGHDAGDGLLQRAARAIRAAFDPYGHSYRVGGDEFVSLLVDAPCELTFERCQTRLDEACEEQNRLQEHPLSIAMGFAVFRSESGEPFYDLVRAADQRMYERKRAMKAAQAGKP